MHLHCFSFEKSDITITVFNHYYSNVLCTIWEWYQNLPSCLLYKYGIFLPFFTTTIAFKSFIFILCTVHIYTFLFITETDIRTSGSEPMNAWVCQNAATFTEANTNPIFVSLHFRECSGSENHQLAAIQLYTAELNMILHSTIVSLVLY